MKNLIYITSFLLPLHVLAFTAKTDGQVPSECQRVYDEAYNVSLNLSIKTADALIGSIDYTRKIIDLKFQSINYFNENKELYGEYMRVNEQKQDLDNAITEAKKAIDEKVRVTDLLILGLKGMETKLARSVYDDMAKEREREIVRQNNRIFYANEEWKKIRTDYYRAYENWIPFENYLQQLTKLEDSLKKTLSDLSGVDQNVKPILETLGTHLSQQWRAEDAGFVCHLIDEQLKKISAIK